MRAQFPLFQSHIDLAHSYWKKLLSPEDKVIDATCGNGHDALFLAHLIPDGCLYCFDIQEQAISATKKRLANSAQVTFFHTSHTNLKECMNGEKVKLIVYNLGYLPGANKELTTQLDSTISSLEQALESLLPGGVISITCYPGHPAGKSEEEAVLNFVEGLDPNIWNVFSHMRLNRVNHPHLLIIQLRVEGS